MARAQDTSLDALRVRLAPAIAAAALFDGWTEAAVLAAADSEGVDPDLARLAFGGEGHVRPMAMITAWIHAVDAAMAAAWPPERLAALSVRARIQTLIEFRLDAAARHEESLRRALAIMAMPQNAASALKLGWESADRMWRLAGDTAADFNHYTKRATLAAIYAAALTVLQGDESEGKAEMRAFVARRIDGVMRFEKAKARWKVPEGHHFSPARFLGRLRYPAK
ncbi:MAG: COQ9 family protein [Sphingomonadales bacterium]|nr:COQ9 family protein [Sphingomonadales bacterium]